MKNLYIIEKSTGKIMSFDSDGFNEFIDINEDLFDGVRLYSVTKESKDIRFKYDNINADSVFTITYSELLELLILNDEK